MKFSQDCTIFRMTLAAAPLQSTNVSADKDYSATPKASAPGSGQQRSIDQRRQSMALQTVDSGRIAKSCKRKSPAKTSTRSRQNSLRRVKNSTDMLRQQSLQRQRSKKEAAADGNQGGREGRQFTVANVGNNGMIYLR